MAPTDLEVRFHQDMVAIYEAGQAPRLSGVLLPRDGLRPRWRETAHALMASPEVSDGFRTRYGVGHLELSVEAHVVRPEYEPLFSSTETARARRRFAQARPRQR